MVDPCLGRQRESIRGLNSSTTNFYEIYYGGSSYGDMTNRLPTSGFSVGAWSGWTFNSTGLAYLNSVNTKTYHKGYAMLGLDLSNVFDSESATWVSNDTYGVSFTTPYLYLVFDTTTPPASLQYGPGSPNAIVGAYISVSGTWRYIVEAKIAIGGTWRDIVA